jgi:hypothetical protein
MTSDQATVDSSPFAWFSQFTSSLLGGGPEKSRAPGFIEGVVADVLRKVLGAFVRGIDKHSLELSVWDGDVRLQGLELRTEVLDALSLPVRCIGGTLGEVRVCVPWRNLLGDEPMILTIDRVLLLLAPRTDDPEDTPDAAPAEAKAALADAAEAAEEQKNAGAQMGPGLVDKLVQRLVAKLQVSVTNVHVRVQGGPEADALAGGIYLRELRVECLPEEPARPHSSKVEQRLLEMLCRKRCATPRCATPRRATPRRATPCRATPRRAACTSPRCAPLRRMVHRLRTRARHRSHMLTRACARPMPPGSPSPDSPPTSTPHAC